MGPQEEESSPTIVGGQPAGKRDLGTGLPHGLEAIVLLAAADSRFCKEFGRDRKGARQRAGIRLTVTERNILDTIGDQRLFAMAKRFGSKLKTPRGTFRATAASLAALASLTASSPPRVEAGASQPPQGPALSQLDSEPPTETPTAFSFGIQPDEPTPTETMPVATGILPDNPTPTATEPPIDGIRPDTPTMTLDPVRGTTSDTPTATPVGIFPDTPTPTPTHRKADLDGNKVVDSRDLFLFIQQWYRARTGQSKSHSTDTNSDAKE